MSDTEIVRITQEQSREAAKAGAFTIQEPDAGAGRQIIHCYIGRLGADWDLADVLALIEDGEDGGWLRHWGGHDLVVLANGSLHQFDVKAPSGTFAATSGSAA